MTDRPMDATDAAGEHPDEGLIHAWLDEALDAAESERLAAHVRECPVCQERVAEARGLIAGASRIVAALDDAPAGSRAGWAQNAVSGAATAAGGAGGDSATPVTDRSLWRWLRVTPARAALAATILVALGITLTQGRLADDSAKPMASVFNPQRADAPAFDSAGEGAGAGGLARSERVAARDPLLDSAVARNLELSQGRRVLKAVPGQPLPQAPPTPSPAAPAELDSRAVVAGRAESQARREITGAVAADRARVGIARDAPASDVVSADREAGAQSSATAKTADVAQLSRETGNDVGITCLRVESAEPGASWGEQTFPMVLAVDPAPASGARGVAVLTTAGAPTPARGSWIGLGGDSVSIILRRIGYAGSMVLGPDRGARAGVAVSSPASAQLEQVAVGEAAPQARSRADGARAEARKAAAPSAAATPPAATATQPSAPAGPPVRQLRVTARATTCPTR